MVVVSIHIFDRRNRRRIEEDSAVVWRNQGEQTVTCIVTCYFLRGGGTVVRALRKTYMKLKLVCGVNVERAIEVNKLMT